MKLFLLGTALAVSALLSACANDAADCERHIAAKDYRLAPLACRKAAEQGDAEAQFSIGWMYFKGKGVERDLREAVKWYRLSAEQGDAWAQYNLGVMYHNGEGVSQDKREAAKWYRKAAEQGFAGGQYNLGLMYAKGEGVIQDYQEAYVWFSLAAIEGDEDARKGRDQAALYLTSAEIGAAQAEAKRRLQATDPTAK